jgi:putative DNA primase/helicase
MSAHSTSQESSLQGSDEEIVERLAALPILQYERLRKDAANRLECRETALDKAVEAKRRKANPTQNRLQGCDLLLADVEPWPEPVNAFELLHLVAETLSRYIALPYGAADAIALWCAHAHSFDAFVCSPRLNITSPEKQCGKTTLRDLLSLLVPRPLSTENLTTAVLFRAVQAYKPTLLADECDAWLGANEDLRALLNAGHRRGGQVLRCVGDDHEVRIFEVFAPAVLCGIGSLPPTLHDRSISISLRRAKRGEIRERFDSRRTQREVELCRRLARFAQDNWSLLELGDPVLPTEAFNRIADNWRPLFAIAEVAGGDWPMRASQAFIQLASSDDAHQHGIGTTLLTDIRELFNEANAERIFSGVLVGALCAMNDRPWPEANRGRAITENWLARHLLPFGIKPKTLRIKTDRAKGYETADFNEAFERYLETPELSIRDTVTSQETSGSSELHNRDKEQSCHGSESHETCINAELSRCHASELEKQQCPVCHQAGMRLDVKWKGDLRCVDTCCINCGSIVETRVPHNGRLEQISKALEY